jgi:hypothetical protein
MNNMRSNYQSYLLRLWRTKGAQDSHRIGPEPVWRASLQSSLTGQRQHFPTLNDLFGFLEQQTGVGAATEDVDD